MKNPHAVGLNNTAVNGSINLVPTSSGWKTQRGSRVAANSQNASKSLNTLNSSLNNSKVGAKNNFKGSFHEKNNKLTAFHHKNQSVSVNLAQSIFSPKSSFVQKAQFPVKKEIRKSGNNKKKGEIMSP